MVKYTSNDYYDVVETWDVLWMMDNVYPVTINFKPAYWAIPDKVMEKIKNYCFRRQIHYIFYSEVGSGGNFHLHGLLITPDEFVRKRFQCWLNAIAKIHTSSKDMEDPKGWLMYCLKQQFKRFL